MTVLILHLFLPVFLYSLLTVAAALCFQLSPLVSTIIGAAVFCLISFPVYRREQLMRGQQPVGFRFFGCLSFILILGIGSCLAVNNMITVTPIPRLFPGYSEVADAIYATPIAVQFVGTVLIIPAAEELVFRGLMFAPLRDRLPFWPAAIVSAVMFGVYHGNMLQGIYAFILGIAMAWLYDKFHSIAASYLYHMAANFISILVVNTGLVILNDTGHRVVFWLTVAVSVISCVICIARIREKVNLKEEEM